jgi:ABC-type multidrug transport system fused ATPase/permease subunit
MFIMIVPIYIVEIAPTEIRGLLGTITELMLYSGVMMVTVIGLLCAWYTSWWKVMLYIAAGLAFLYTIAVLCAPESPRWLLRTGRFDDAEKSLLRLRSGVVGHTDEYFRIITAARRSQQEQLLVPETEVAPQQPVQINYAWKSLMIGCCIHAIKQLSGVYAVQFYAVLIFETATDSTLLAIIAASILYFVIVVLLFVALLKIESMQRRTALIGSLIGMGFFCFLIAGFGDAIDDLEYGIAWKTILFTGYMGCFALGIGPVSWLYCSELFPCNTRVLFSSISTATHWFVAFLICATFSDLASYFGTNGVFWIFGGCCALGVVFVYFVAPETKGRSLEEIEFEMRVEHQDQEKQHQRKPSQLAAA